MDKIEKLKSIIQDCNINFLIGSGMSVPFFSTLANIEVLLYDLNENTTLTPQEKEIIRASIFGKYFENTILKNVDLVDDGYSDDDKKSVLRNYKNFLVSLNTIVLKRKSSILNKQINLFTTNIDVFFEKALELSQLEFNDGFYGRFNPIFSLTNFKKSYLKKSLHYDNTSEIPVFNLLKIHGSLTWKSSKDKIFYSYLMEIDQVETKWNEVKAKLIEFEPTDGLPHFVAKVKEIENDKLHAEFINAYNKLAIVNPTKEKFQDTILNLYYYELIRVLSNELEKENSLLIIMGFSFADEHLREIILRAANSNPTLAVIIFAFDSKSKIDIDLNISKGNSTIRYNNIEVLEPEEDTKYDFETLNSVFFNSILKSID